jgi:hypothetical protein
MLIFLDVQSLNSIEKIEKLYIFLQKIFNKYFIFRLIQDQTKNLLKLKIGYCETLDADFKILK